MAHVAKFEEEPICPKCRHGHPQRTHCISEVQDKPAEYLQMKCTRCTYSWPMEVATED